MPNCALHIIMAAMLYVMQTHFIPLESYCAYLQKTVGVRYPMGCLNFKLCEVVCHDGTDTLQVTRIYLLLYYFNPNYRVLRIIR